MLYHASNCRQTWFRCRCATIKNLSRHSTCSVCMNRSTWARRLGDNGVFRLILASLFSNTASNWAVNFVSLSRITIFGARSMWPALEILIKRNEGRQPLR